MAVAGERGDQSAQIARLVIEIRQQVSQSAVDRLPSAAESGGRFRVQDVAGLIARHRGLPIATLSSGTAPIRTTTMRARKDQAWRSRACVRGARRQIGKISRENREDSA